MNVDFRKEWLSCDKSRSVGDGVFLHSDYIGPEDLNIHFRGLKIYVHCLYSINLVFYFGFCFVLFVLTQTSHLPRHPKVQH